MLWSCHFVILPNSVHTGYTLCMLKSPFRILNLLDQGCFWHNRCPMHTWGTWSVKSSLPTSLHSTVIPLIAWHICLYGMCIWHCMCRFYCKLHSLVMWCVMYKYYMIAHNCLGLAIHALIALSCRQFHVHASQTQVFTPFETSVHQQIRNWHSIENI